MCDVDTGVTLGDMMVRHVLPMVEKHCPRWSF